MEATTQHFTAEQWARHEKFVEMLRAVKQRKRERQAKIEATLAQGRRSKIPTPNL